MQYQTQQFVYDSATGLLSKNGRENKLTKKQGKLLIYFFENSKKIISKETLMDNVWGRIVTGNTVDQVILTLRNHIEDVPSKPQIIVTHFGLGISFDADVEIITPQNISITKVNSSAGNSEKPNFFKLKNIVPLIFVLAISFSFNYLGQGGVPEDLNMSDKKILVLPFEINGENMSEIEQSGMKSLLKSSVRQMQSEGQLIFDETSQTVKQAVKKHWKLNENLVVLHSNVIKNGDVYEAVIELSNGLKTIEKTSIKANNLSAILNGQIMFLSQISNYEVDKKLPVTINQLLIEASGQKSLGKLSSAEELFKQVLLEDDENYQVRFELAEIYKLQKHYEKSLSNFEALKSTPIYNSMGSEIELNISEIHFLNNDYGAVIDGLKTFIASNSSLTHTNQAKVSMQLGRAYYHLGKTNKAIEFYKKAIIHTDEQLNPLVYSKSYYRQGEALLVATLGDSVVSLFEKSLKYAKLAGNLHYQNLALNRLADIAMSRYDWDEAVALNKQAIHLLELNDNKDETAKALSTLTNILNLQGKFSDAKAVNDRLSVIADEIDSDSLRLIFMHYDAIIAMNKFNWEYARQQINAHFRLATLTNDYFMLLNNAFTTLELMLITDQTHNFMKEWNKRSDFIKEQKFSRFQLYLDYYLARYYMKVNQDEKALVIINKVTEQSMQSNDFKIMVDMQHELVLLLLKTDANKALNILNSLEQYNPHPNPQLELQALALHKLGKNIEALSVMNQAKLVYHESWTFENQTLLETIQNSIP